MISKFPLLVDVTKHRPALFVKPVFTPYTPFRVPSNSFVLFMVLAFPSIVMVYVFVPTIFLNSGLSSAYFVIFAN